MIIELNIPKEKRLEIYKKALSDILDGSFNKLDGLCIHLRTLSGYKNEDFFYTQTINFFPEFAKCIEVIWYKAKANILKFHEIYNHYDFEKNEEWRIKVLEFCIEECNTNNN